MKKNGIEYNYGDSHFSKWIDHPVLQRYLEPHRFYHGIDHIKYMFRQLNLLINSYVNLTDEELECLSLMIIYHDAVYNIPDPDRQNEIKSNELFLKDYPDHEHRQLISDGILATIDHKPSESSHELIKIMCDLDLMGLSTPRSRYMNDVKLIKEFGVTDEEWLSGRGEWLESFLDGRDKIFHHPAYDDFNHYTFEALNRQLEWFKSGNTEKYMELLNYTRERS